MNDLRHPHVCLIATVRNVVETTIGQTARERDATLAEQMRDGTHAALHLATCKNFNYQPVPMVETEAAVDAEA